jgi:hypothetical protein
MDELTTQDDTIVNAVLKAPSHAKTVLLAFAGALRASSSE